MLLLGYLLFLNKMDDDIRNMINIQNQLIMALGKATVNNSKNIHQLLNLFEGVENVLLKISETQSVINEYIQKLMEGKNGQCEPAA